MSWDVFVMNFPKEAETVEDIPDDFVPPPLGTRAELIARIKVVVPFAEFSDPSWGTIEGPDFSIEVNLGKDDTVSDFALHVRGSDTAAGVVADIISTLGLRAIAVPPGDFFDPATAKEAMAHWRAYRDHVVKNQ